MNPLLSVLKNAWCLLIALAHFVESFLEFHLGMSFSFGSLDEAARAWKAGPVLNHREDAFGESGESRKHRCQSRFVLQ